MMEPMRYIAPNVWTVHGLFPMIGTNPPQHEELSSHVHSR